MPDWRVTFISNQSIGPLANCVSQCPIAAVSTTRKQYSLVLEYNHYKLSCSLTFCHNLYLFGMTTESLVTQCTINQLGFW